MDRPVRRVEQTTDFAAKSEGATPLPWEIAPLGPGPLSDDRELRSNIEWRLNNLLSVHGSNVNDVSSSAVGNLGVDLRWRLEFE